MPPTELELVSHHLCPYVQRSVITLTEKQIPHRRTNIDLANKPAWFRRLSPLGKVPLLRVDGQTLFESAVICEYLDETTPGSLHPADPLEKAQHRSWIEFGSSILDAIAGFYNAQTPEAFAVKRQVLMDRLQWLDGKLGEGPFFAGRSFTMVDAAFGPVFRYFDMFEQIDDFGFFDRTRNIEAWRRALGDRQSVRDAVASDYAPRLLDFLVRRNSHLSSLIPQSETLAAF